MKILISTIAITTLLLTAQAYAESPNHNHQDHAHQDHNHQGQLAEKPASQLVGATCENTIEVKVNGLVCDFCARALEKIFSKRDEVSGINVDLDKSLVTVAVKPGKTIDDATLTKLITDSGYNVSAIDRGC